VSVPCFLPFLCFRKVTQEIFLELDETKASRPEFYRSFQRTEGKTEWGHEGPSHQGGMARCWAAPLCVRPPRSTPDDAPSPIKTPLTRKTKGPDQFSRTHCDPPPPLTRRSGGSRSSSRHPAREGNRHRRSSSLPCLPPER
jgi:hypothetical protein